MLCPWVRRKPVVKDAIVCLTSDLADRGAGLVLTEPFFAQQVVIGLKEGDGPASAAKAGLASRTNTLFSGPMVFGMLGANMSVGGSTGVFAAMGLILALEVNALVGKMGPMTSVVGVIHSSIALTGIIWALLAFL